MFLYAYARVRASRSLDMEWVRKRSLQPAAAAAQESAEGLMYFSRGRAYVYC